ncbi:MAG: hypothetical protein AB7I32_10940 [Gammaproteobacteria bacterium]
MTDPVETVHALVAPAMQSLACGTFAHLAPGLRAAIAAVPAERRIDIALPVAVIEELITPVLERLGPEFVRSRLGAGFVALDFEARARAIATLWGAILAGEIGFDA